MKSIIKYVRADQMKLKGTYFYMIHLLVPIGIAAIFLIYYSFSGLNQQEKLVSYYVVLGMGFPILIGLLTAMLAEQEQNAGNYQMMLAIPDRFAAFFSKAYILIKHGCLAIFMASLLFGVGNIVLLHQSQVDISFYLLAAVFLMSEAIILYLFHLFFAMRFNKGVSIILGIAEGLISVLFRTSLGDGVWCYIPCSWSTRFVNNYVLWIQSGFVEACCKTAVWCCMIMSCSVVLFFYTWCKKWEGIHSAE